MRLHPHRFEVPNFDKITIVRVGGSLSNKIVWIFFHVVVVVVVFNKQVTK